VVATLQPFREVEMKALVFHGAGKQAWEEVPDPMIIDPTDAIVKIDMTTICGTDLHIMKGDVAAVTNGRILGHEAVGTVLSVGSAVSQVKPGDKVIVSCIAKKDCHLIAFKLVESVGYLATSLTGRKLKWFVSHLQELP
jgi:threonine dehydrogenase-like Zn-dependent dehydrogenase